MVYRPRASSATQLDLDLFAPPPAPILESDQDAPYGRIASAARDIANEPFRARLERRLRLTPGTTASAIALLDDLERYRRSRG